MDKACTSCHYLVSKGTECPVCRGTEFTSVWNSVLIVYDPERSELAKKAKIKTPGKYALRVG